MLYNTIETFQSVIIKILPSIQQKPDRGQYKLGQTELNYRFIDSKNSSLLLLCNICLRMNSMASSGFISAR